MKKTIRLMLLVFAFAMGGFVASYLLTIPNMMAHLFFVLLVIIFGYLFHFIDVQICRYFDKKTNK